MRPVAEEGSLTLTLTERKSYLADRDRDGDEGGEGRAPVRKRSERAV